MNARTVEISVGVLVILGIAALLMLAMQVSGLSDFYRAEQGYKISAIFKNIGGLKVKSKVTIGGVTIGRVTGIELKFENEEYFPVVEMSIDSHVNKIPLDSQASILTAGLLGDNYIGIEAGHDEEFLAAGDSITLTSQAILLEELISKFAVGNSNPSDSKSGNSSKD